MKVTAFVNVNVVPMDSERILTKHTVVVEDDQIIALGPSNQIKVPASAVRIDGGGKYLIPGLADMHVHGGFRDVTGSQVPYIAEGITTIRYFEIPDSGLVQHFKQAEAQGGPHIYTPKFYVQAPAWVQGRRWRDSSMAANVAAAKATGHPFVYLHSGTVNQPDVRSSPVVDSLLVAAHGQGLEVAAHDHGSLFSKTLALGAVGGSIEHLAWFRDTLTGFSWQQFGPIGEPEAERAVAKIPPLAAAVARAGLWVTPTLHCIVDSYNPHPLQTMLVRRIVKGLQDAGVRLLLGGDDAYSVHNELAALVQAGLTPYQALVAGTRNPAQYMGLLDSNGTVAVGKRADLVLLSGNPLQDIRYTREPAGVMFHGQWFDRSELDRRLFAYRTRRGASWFRSELRLVIPANPHPSADTTMGAFMLWGQTFTQQFQELEARAKHFEALNDSLAAIQTPGSKETGVAARLRQQMAEELEAIRMMLPPEKYVEFDPIARVWLREQARQGHAMAIPGVALSP